MRRDRNKETERKSFRRPLLIVVSVAILDLLVRLALHFEMKRVTLFEAVLFALAAIFLIWPFAHDKRWPRINTWLALVFGLGSLRAGLWSGGLPVSMANAIVLCVFLLAVIGYGIRRRMFRRRAAV